MVIGDGSSVDIAELCKKKKMFECLEESRGKELRDLGKFYWL